MKKILFVLFMLLLLTGCSTKGVAKPKTYAQNITPSLLRVGDFSMNSGYCYLIDEKTGVVYLEFDSEYRHAVTVMLNADGTPITAEQLGIKY